MIINVTQEHINQGWRKSCRRCPVALAIQEVIRDKVIIVSQRIYIYKDKEAYDLSKWELILEYPAIVKTFIDTFDDGGLVEPFSFEIPYEQNT